MKLLPCPFCGGKVYEDRYDYQNTISCNGCGTVLNIETKIWNTRAYLRLKKAIEEMEAQIAILVEKNSLVFNRRFAGYIQGIYFAIDKLKIHIPEVKDE